MNKLFQVLLLTVAAALALWPSAASAQTVDEVKGVWNGRMMSGQASQEMWLMIGANATRISGTITPDMNSSKLDWDLENVVFRSGVLTCEYVDPRPATPVRVFLELKAASGTMTGTFRDSSGGSGTVQFSRRLGPAAPAKPEEPFLGTWTGEMVSGKTRTDARLVLSEGGAGPAGLMTPDVNDVLQDLELDHIVVKDETLTCDFKDVRSLKPVLVTLELKLTDSVTLEGKFRDASGKQGTIVLTKELDEPSPVR